MSTLTAPDPFQIQTRLRLIEAAGPIFADRGFDDATVRDIVAAAHANVAAVNYHFRDKVGLYKAVFRHFHEESIKLYPPDEGVSSDDSAEERLFAFVRSFFRRIFAGGKPAWFSNLMLREMIRPTVSLDEVMNEKMCGIRDVLHVIVADLIGQGVTDTQMFYATSSIIGQIVFHRHCNPIIARMNPDQKYDAEGVDALARHVTDFSLAGLKGMRAPAVNNGSKRRVAVAAR